MGFSLADLATEAKGAPGRARSSPARSAPDSSLDPRFPAFREAHTRGTEGA